MGTIQEDDEIDNGDIDSEEDEVKLKWHCYTTMCPIECSLSPSPCFQVLNRPKGSKKASSLFADGFEFSVDSSWGGEGEELGWRVGDEVMQMATKRQVKGGLGH